MFRLSPRLFYKQRRSALRESILRRGARDFWACSKASHRIGCKLWGRKVSPPIKPILGLSGTLIRFRVFNAKPTKSSVCVAGAPFPRRSAKKSRAVQKTNTRSPALGERKPVGRNKNKTRLGSSFNYALSKFCQKDREFGWLRERQRVSIFPVVNHVLRDSWPEIWILMTSSHIPMGASECSSIGLWTAFMSHLRVHSRHKESLLSRALMKRLVKRNKLGTINVFTSV